MYEFGYYYIKPKYKQNTKLCYMDTDGYVTWIRNIKTEDVYEGIADDVEKRSDTSSYEVNRPLPTEKNTKVIGSMKDELEGKIMTKFVAVRPKNYCSLIFNFNDCKNRLLNNKIISKSQQRFKSEAHNVYTEEINKTALSNSDDKRLQTFDRITSYPYGSSVGKVCKTEILSKYK